jgi:methyltransferase (TIGR00027 family)
VRQVVILAAGLDSRAYRLPWPDGTVIFELDQPRVREFKRDVLAKHGVEPTAQLRAIAVDLRVDWAQALRDNGFDPSTPSAWIAEGLLIYLPGAAQEQLFRGVDALACSGSRLAVEEQTPVPGELFEAKKAEERSTEGGTTYFNLIFNEQHAPADEWFSARGWTAVPTPLTDYLRQVGRPIAGADDSAGPDAGFMQRLVSLVSAVKG